MLIKNFIASKELILLLICPILKCNFNKDNMSNITLFVQQVGGLYLF